MLILSIFTGRINAQTEFDRINKYAVPTTTAKFHEASFSEPELCTGKIKYDLPFHSISLKDVEIPVGISYCSNGIQIKSVASRVGQEWSLIAGGAVTRKKRGSQNDYDDYYYPYPISKNLDGWQTADSASVDGYQDGEPDIMVVNAPGLYSEFIIDRNDQAFVLDGQKIKLNIVVDEIDLPDNQVVFCDGITIYPIRDDIKDIESLVITNDMGYEYTFDHIAWNAYITLTSHDWDISSWYLTKIESPYGQEVTYTYDDNGKVAITSARTEILEAETSSYYADDLYFANPPNHIYSRNITLNNKVRLRGIDFDGGEVDFNYNFSRSDLSGDYALSEVLIKDISSTTVKKVNLSYSHFTGGGSTTRLKLTKVEIKSPNNSIEDEFQLEYYTGDVPDEDSYEYDYFGFYNANNATDWTTKLYAYYGTQLRQTSFLPFLKSGNYVILDSNGANRAPSISAKNGLLKKVTLPTGGYREFSYELNEWNNYDIPGLRLTQEKLYDGSNSVYIYYDYGGSTVNFPKQACLIEYTDASTDSWTNTQKETFIQDHTARFAYDRMNNEFFNGSNIIYNMVEKYQQGNGKTIYCYQTPSDPSLNFETEGSSLSLYVNPGSGFPFCVGQSYKNRRGRLIEEAVIDENDYLVKIIAYEYDLASYSSSTPDGHIRKEVSNNNFIRCWYDLNSGRYVLTGKIEATPPANTSESLLSYGQNFDHLEDDNDTHTYNFVKQKTYYEYNSYGLNTNVCKIQSDGTGLNQLIRYPNNINSTVYNNMVTLNMLNYPIETLQGTGLEQVTHILSGSLNTYKSGAGSYVKDKIYTTDIETPVTYSYFTYYTGSVGSDYLTENVITFNTYNGNGDITKYTTGDGVTVHYLWGYNNTYPVAKIKSSSSTDISSTIRNNIVNKVFSYSDDLSYINQDVSYLQTQLSSYIGNSTYFVNLYTYKPLVGLTSTTDPTGVTSFYQYDDFGRLEIMKNDDEKLLKKFVYNYGN